MKKALFLLLIPCALWSQSLKVEVNNLFHNREYSKAERLVSSYLESTPDDYLAIELLGDSFGHQKKWDEAIDCYGKLVEAFPQNANLHYKYGGALGMKALSISKFGALVMIDDIKNAFHTSAKLDPNHINTRWALVELYVQLPGIIGGSYKKALLYAQELQELSEVDGHLAKGYVYENKGEEDNAEYHYKKAVEIGGSVTCYDKLTRFYENQNKPDMAIRSLEQASRTMNRNSLHYQLGKVSADYNVQLEKGERCLKTFIENHTTKDGVPVEWAYYRLAQISKHRNDKAQALEWLDKALELKSDFKQALKEKEVINSL